MSDIFSDSRSVSNSIFYVGNTSTDDWNRTSSIAYTTCGSLGSNLAIPSGGGGVTVNCASVSIGRYVTIWKSNIEGVIVVCELVVSGNQLSGEKALV